MFIVQLAGGLGNQLFQFSFGRALALRHDQELKFDLRFLLKANQHSGYALGEFLYKLQIASAADLLRYPMLTSSIAERIKTQVNPFLGITTEVGMAYSNHYFDTVSSTNMLYRGYWQSEKFFKTIESQIRDDLLFIRSDEFDTMAVIAEIKSCNAVSIHVRRGDYIKNTAAAAVYFQCGQEYYVKAMQLIFEKVENPVFFVFSDDIVYAKSIFNKYGPRVRYVDSTTSPYEDMYAMSCCKHNIIANSTFSWWGAWLNCNENKVVVSPTKWFNDASISNNIIPEYFYSI